MWSHCSNTSLMLTDILLRTLLKSKICNSVYSTYKDDTRHFHLAILLNSGILLHSCWSSSKLRSKVYDPENNKITYNSLYRSAMLPETYSQSFGQLRQEQLHLETGHYIQELEDLSCPLEHNYKKDSTKPFPSGTLDITVWQSAMRRKKW